MRKIWKLKELIKSASELEGECGGDLSDGQFTLCLLLVKVTIYS